MPENETQIISLIQELYAFRNLTEAELAKVAAVAEITRLAVEQSLTLGEDTRSPFYMIISGKVNLEVQVERSKVEILKRAEFFGADFLLYGKLRPARATALAPTELLCLQTDKLYWLLTEIPALREGLKSVEEVHRRTHDRHFNWLGDEELVQLVVRKHPAYLLVTEVVPMLIGWLGTALLVGTFFVDIASFRLALTYTGISILAAAVLYGIWKLLDWGNDYYIVTDQRVVWLEQIIGLYDSRQESPLTAVKSNAITIPFWGRIFGYGNVIINAFMGEIVFRNVGNPNGVKTMIDKYVRMANERLQHSDKAKMGQLIRKRIEPPPEPSPAARPEAIGSKPASPQGGKLSRSLKARLSNLFRTRWEEGDVITYRTHGYILFLKIGGPTAIELMLSALMVLLFRGAAKGTLDTGVVVTTFLALMLVMIIVFLWWLYQYLDWHNDIFQITSEKIIDSIKKPLGTEVTKSAPLANIQSMDYIRRGLLGVLLNFGSVFINVGTETKLVFKDIGEPARVQQDIFNHMYDNQRKKQLADIMKQGDQIADWLAAYHQQVEELRKEQNKTQNE